LIETGLVQWIIEQRRETKGELICIIYYGWSLLLSYETFDAIGRNSI
jgi:hypothetical protein